MFVVLSDFENRPYKIPNQEESKDLQNFIDVAEEKILKSLLGVVLYDELAEGTDMTESLIAQKWLDLRDGDTYSFTGSDLTYEYKGLVSFLVPCIYSLWLTETRDKYTNSSTGFNTSDKFERISPARRIVESYNDFFRQVGNYWNQWNTLYGFLTANTTTYNDFDGSLFTAIGTDDQPNSINEFGI